MKRKENKPAGSGSKDRYDGPTEARLAADLEGALRQAPEVVIPVDFAARVAAEITSLPLPARSPWAGLGPGMALVSGVVLTATLFAFAPHVPPSVRDLRFGLEMVVLGELGLVGYLLSRFGLRD